MHDPLYLFARCPADQYLAEWLEEAWAPLLAYMQEIYSYPIHLDGSSAMRLDLTTPTMDIFFKAKNFTYDHPSHTLDAGRAFQSVSSIASIGNFIKNGVITTLTIHIPEHRDHAFWHLDSSECNEKLFGCDESKDTLSFQVSRWGPDAKRADYCATQRAMDIIWNIRASVRNPTYLSKYISPTTAQSLRISNSLEDPCPMFCVGAKLNSIWKSSTPIFATTNSEQTVSLAISLIEHFINSETVPPPLVPAFKYYQVHGYFVITNLDRHSFM